MYVVAEIGRRGWERLGTTMRNRSSHIPISTLTEAATVPHTVPRVREFARRTNGTRKHVTIIVQNNGEKAPSVFERKTTMCVGSAP